MRRLRIDFHCMGMRKIGQIQLSVRPLRLRRPDFKKNIPVRRHVGECWQTEADAKS